MVSITFQTKADLLLAKLYFEFDYAEMHDLAIDPDKILDWYSQELNCLDEQPFGKEAA